MREIPLRRAWKEGRPTLGGWLMLPDSFAAEIMAKSGFDWLCIDLQHGLIDYPTAVGMLQAISTTDATPLVRVPWNEPGIIGKCLDAGAAGVIVPMVNGADEARAAVAACRYAPDGRRSYGPVRAGYHFGSDYFEHANREVLCIPMIETREALDRLDEILDVPGIDGVYVGPADLSITLGLAPGADQSDETFTDALARIVAACNERGIVPGIAGTVTTASKRIDQGFLLVEVAADAGTLAFGAGRALARIRQSGEPETKSTYL